VPAPVKETTDMKRRYFLQWFVRLSSVLIAGLLSLPVVRFLFANVAQQQQRNWYPLMKLDIFLEKVTQARLRRVIRDGWLTEVLEQYVWIVKKQDGSFLVLNSHCTHLGCLVSWDQKSRSFLCPCHGGKFDENGNRIAGPPPRPLERYETKIENNTLLIKV
jgi:quinol---cytochrome c reductase iron-sulfur subunit, bacillus type